MQVLIVGAGGTSFLLSEGRIVTTPSHPVRRVTRPLLALLAGPVLLLTAACGFDAQTLQPYTPAMG